MSKRKITDEFKQEVASKGNHEYEVLNGYINNHTKVTFKHLICGHTFLIPLV